MTPLGVQWRDSAIYTHVFILPQTPFLSRLPHNIEHSSRCYTVGPYSCLLIFDYILDFINNTLYRLYSFMFPRMSADFYFSRELTWLASNIKFCFLLLLKQQNFLFGSFSFLVLTFCQAHWSLPCTWIALTVSQGFGQNLCACFGVHSPKWFFPF